MKAKLYVLIAACLLATAGLHAEFKVQSVITEARNDTENAPAIVANAALDNPKSAVKILQAAVTALPDQAPAILEMLLKVLPKQALEFVRAAILAQPKLARELTAIAVATLPDQAPDIIKTAVDASPEDLRSAVAATTVDKLSSSTSSGSGSKSPAFPVQPIRPDLVSPSS